MFKWSCLIAVWIGLTPVAWAGSVLHISGKLVHPREVQRQLSSLYASSNKRTEWILQFKNAVSGVERQALRRQGVEIFASLNEDALLLRSDYATLDAFMKAHLAVNAFVPYAGGYKISNDLGITNLFNQDRRLILEVTAFKSSETSEIAEAIQALGGSSVRLLKVEDARMEILLPRNLIPLVAAMTGVESLKTGSADLNAPVWMEAERLFPESLPTQDLKDVSSYELSREGDSSEAAGPRQSL